METGAVPYARPAQPYAFKKSYSDAPFLISSSCPLCAPTHVSSPSFPILAPIPGGPQPRARRLRILPWQGLLHVISVIVAVLMARFAIFDVVQFVSSSRPTEGMLLGALLLATGAGMLPLVWKCYPGSQVGVG